MKNHWFKKITHQLHLWLGLITGSIVFIIAITGCLYAFKDEIENVTQPYRYVQIENKEFLPPSRIQKIAEKVLPNIPLHAIEYHEKNESVQAIFYQEEPKHYYVVYLNPYNGKVLQTVNMEAGFFRWVLNGHFYLWLPKAIGQPLVATITVLFFFLVISGIILWWPKNKKVFDKRIWFRWKEGIKWKRKNYDLHSITGFYICAFALIFIITGLVWGFKWFAYSYYTGIGGEKSLIYQEPVSVKSDNFKATNPEASIDYIWQQLQKTEPQAKSIEVHIPETDTSSISVNINTDKGTYWKRDFRYYDQYTLQELPVNHLYGRFKNADVSDKIMRMNYDIHVGAILGLPGKIFAFLISLLIASLPVTGFLIWYGRKFKSKN